MIEISKNSVSVPIRLDAIWSDGKTILSPPASQFGSLSNTVDKTKPWLGNTTSITLNSDFSLDAGLHLHWTLPDALRNGTTIYTLDYQVFNELVQQGMPCELVDSLKQAAKVGLEYSLDELNKILAGLVESDKTLNNASDFDLLPNASRYGELISSDTAINVQTYMPKFKWDSVFMEIYGPMIINSAARMKLPPVPDRWLVIRNNVKKDTTDAWVVESDRLSAPIKQTSSAVAGPGAIPGQFSANFVAHENAVKKANSYQLLGLTTPVKDWLEDSSVPRLEPFTAIGNGSSDFAAFYPNCQGVFGFYDGSAKQDTTYTYTIIGWFANAVNDPISTQYNVFPWAELSTPAERAATLDWVIEDADWKTIERSIYTAKINVKGSDCLVQPSTKLANVDVAIGNTAGEALAAYIAQGKNDYTLGVTPEDILNAAQAGILQQVLEPDGPAIIENALHAQSFQAKHGDWIWQISDAPKTYSGLSKSSPTPRVVITDAVAQAINELNVAQLAFDQAQLTLKSERHLLFTDWCRASHLGTDASGRSPKVYPNGTTVSNSGLQLVFMAGLAVNTAAEAIQIASVGGNDMKSMLPYVAMKSLYLAHEAVLKALNDMPGGDTMILRRQPAPRYFRPNDPVVLMSETSGSDLTITPADPLPAIEIDGQSYLLLQVISPGNEFPSYLPQNWDTNSAVPSGTCISGAVAQIKTLTYTGSWRPLSLYWQTEFQQFPGVGRVTATGTKPPFAVSKYDQNFLTTNFTQDASGIDYIPRAGKEPIADYNAFYRGRVNLTDHAQETMRARILQLTGQTSNPPENSDGLTLPGLLGEGLVKKLIGEAYDNNAQILSQTLSGFNDRLLMLERLPQVSVFDPGYTSAWNLEKVPVWDSLSQSFYNEIGQQNRTSPNQNDIYNPIRAGKCELTNLTLIDAFGQLRRWDYCAQPLNTIISEALPNETAKVQNPAPAFFLAPRITQPSRLLFRWLAADGSNDVESNQSPDTTPVCGWVALNRVDENVMVFTQEGTLVCWIPAGGGDATYLPDRSFADITDPFLQQVVLQAQQTSNSFYDDINTALLTIGPRSHRHTANRSVLESQPLALARASMQLQLAGSASPHQGYEALATLVRSTSQRLATGPAPSPYLERRDCGFTEVNFPVRLGDVSMDDDGLVLYWSISDSMIADDYSLVSTDSEINPDQEPAISLKCGWNEPSVQALLLLDPRSPVHVTSGILPVKDITIPAAMYDAALSNMDYLMQVDMVLGTEGSVYMPLPSEIKGDWKWIYTKDGTWSTAEIPQNTDNQIHPQSDPAVMRSGFLIVGSQNT